MRTAVLALVLLAVGCRTGGTGSTDGLSVDLFLSSTCLGKADTCRCTLAITNTTDRDITFTFGSTVQFELLFLDLFNNVQQSYPGFGFTMVTLLTAPAFGQETKVLTFTRKGLPVARMNAGIYKVRGKLAGYDVPYDEVVVTFR